MDWNNELILEFLDLFEGEKIIWNPQHENHKDRSEVHEAWKRVQGALSVEFSLKELKKKKENLMATYRKLSMKVKNSKKSGAGAYDVYKPEWFAYEKMDQFLHSVYTPRVYRHSDVKLEDELDDIACDELDNEVETSDVADQIESADINSASHEEESREATATETAANEDGPPISKKRKVALVEKRMDDAYLLLKQVVTRPKVAKDESQAFCDLMCLKLRALDENTRERAMHEINNLIYHLKHQPSSIPSMPMPYYQPPGYYPVMAQPWPGMSNFQPPNYGFRENSSSRLSPAHTPTSNDAQSNVNDDQREVSNRVGHRSAEKKKGL